MHVIDQSATAQGTRAGAYVNDAQRLDGKAATVPRDNMKRIHSPECGVSGME